MEVKMAQQPLVNALPSIGTSSNNNGFSSCDHRSTTARSVQITTPRNDFIPNMPEEGIDLGRIRLEKRTQHLPPSVRNMAEVFRSRSGKTNMSLDFPPMFDPLPFQAQFFKSSTLLKMVPVPRRHAELFPPKPASLINREKPVIIHSERYQYSDPLRPGYERMSQRDRLLAEQEYSLRLKQQKRARETLPHRESRDLLMGGRPVPFSERFDIKDELRRLKAIVLPVNARELYHGKGINLPPDHSSIKPRKTMPPARPLGEKLNGKTPCPPIPASPDLEDSMTSEALLFSHSKTSLDGLRGKKKPQRKTSKPNTVVPTGEIGRSNSFPTIDRNRSQLSRRSTENNLIPPVPEDEVFSEAPPADETIERLTSRAESVKDSTFLTTERARAESEMDIILPPESEHPVTPKIATPIKAPTPNPLKAADLSLYKISEEEMKAVFKKLDTDSDGHLLYQQLESRFPQSISSTERKYLKQIYDITSASTFFGMSEFMTISCLCDEICTLSNELLTSGYEQINFTTLTTVIIQFTELFQQIDRSGRGKITLTSLEDIICTALHRERADIEYGLSLITEVLQLKTADVNKVKFVAGIPYFLTISTLKSPEEPEADSQEPEGQS